MDALIFKKKEVKKAKATETFNKLPVPKIKTDLNNKSGNNKINNQRKKKYLDTILTNNFTNNYFKKKELKIKNFKLPTTN